MSAWERFERERPNPSSAGLVACATGPDPWCAGSWDRARRTANRRISRPTVARFQNICISREAGAGGGTIARLVGQRLGWKVYDHELLEAIAHRMGVPVDEVRCFDELAPSVVQDWLLPLREEHYAPAGSVS